MLRTLSLLTAILCASTAALAEIYPDRPVRVAIGFAAGSGPDIQGRTVSQQLGTALGQQFYVENRLGANGTIAARSVATSKPDGYSLLFSSSSIISTPHIYKSLGYDTLTDLKPIATVGELDGIFMLVDSKSPIKTLALDDYRRRVLSDRDDNGDRGRSERSAKPQRNSGNGKGEARPNPKPLRKKVEQAEAEVARLTREIEKLDAALADGQLFARDPAKAAAIAKTRSDNAGALAKAEEDWLSAGAALEAATS